MAFAFVSQKECSTLEYIGMGRTFCISWCTPVLSRNDYVFHFLLNQLDSNVWIALIFSLLSFFLITIAISTASHEDWTCNDAFKVASFIYGQPAPSQPRTLPVRMVVAVWLFACLVMRAAYEGELKVIRRGPLKHVFCTIIMT